MPKQTVEIEITLVSRTCAQCGLTFGLPDYYGAELRRSHATCYCPNGHARWFPDKSEVEKLQKDLNAAKQLATWYKADALRQRAEREQAERRLSATRGVLTRVKHRIANGVCPCGNRSFEHLQRHMSRQHPAYKTTEP